MASLGRLDVAAVQTNQELVAALANINFDFSLIKVEAPPEYFGVGAALSTHRRQVAETGMPHVTARKLGVLFEGLLPSTPKFIEAYGIRASEIAKKTSEMSVYGEQAGPFADFTGPDATTIWAAATSGKAAMAVHLLACMLARLWSPAQATSIWAELVDARKQHIAKGLEHEQNLGIYLASQCQITREQLAEWDNGARAWLRRADHVKKLQQTQLMLVCNNLDIPVNAKLDVYENVIAGWLTSLRGMEDLLSGLPQRLQDGALLLALSSWHMYPDMTILGQREIRQHDELIPSIADIILNLESSPAHGSRGVYWCLSLSKLRFYGDPTVYQQSLNLESSRWNIEQLSCIALGSVIGGWGRHGRKITLACKMIARLSDMAYGSSSDPSPSKQPRWLRMLAEGARGLLDTDEDNRGMCLRLVRLGRGAGSSFLANPDKHPPYLFGLARVSEFLSLMATPLHRVMLLSKITRLCFPNANYTDAIIRYHIDGDQSRAESYGYITALPSPAGVFYNWTAVQSSAIELEKHPWLPKSAAWRIEWHPLPKPSGGVKSFMTRKWDFHNKTNPFFEHLVKKATYASIARSTSDSSLPDSADNLPQNNEAGSPSATTPSIPVQDLEITPGNTVSTLPAPKIQYPHFYAMATGELHTAGLFLSNRLDDIKIPSTVEFDDFEGAFTNGWIDPAALRRSIESVTFWAATLGYRDYASSLLALGFIEQVYQTLGDATVTPSIIKSPLHSARWLGIGENHTYNELNKNQDFDFSREEAFSCICYLDTGLDLRPDTFQKVMAVSTGDSIYVAGGLLCDPMALQKRALIKRLNGNIGKPGVALLVPPPSPLCRQPDPGQWQLINLDSYDGRHMEDTFYNTTLHLSFTGWTLQVDALTTSLERGLVDKEAEIYEALVSVHDGGKWVADLDVLTAISKSSSDPRHDYFYKVGCKHSQSMLTTADHLDSGLKDWEEMENITMITSWEELLDFLNHPKGPVIVLSHRNWTARLAIVALSVLRQMRVVVNDGFCRGCYQEAEKHGSDFLDRTIFIS